jgi:hypothetical protein
MASASIARFAASIPALSLLRATADYEVVGASPELLLQVDRDRMTTHPIAGTRPRGIDDATMSASPTSSSATPGARRARHARSRAQRPGSRGAAGHVAVTRYMEVERYSHVLHLVSHVEARLRPDLDALDALKSVFPAGTLSGAPKVRAMQLIAELEGERRGLYGGAAGYIGYDGNLDTAITIRSAVLKDGVAHIHTGAASWPARCRSESSRRPSTRQPPCAEPSSRLPRRWPPSRRQAPATASAPEGAPTGSPPEGAPA